jgi:hypothetical protein
VIGFRLFGCRLTSLRKLAIIAPIAVTFASALAVVPAYAAMNPGLNPDATVRVTTAKLADSTPVCKPEAGQTVSSQSDNQCPPPVVPEAPLPVLLPLSAGAVLLLAYFVARRRPDMNRT